MQISQLVAPFVAAHKGLGKQLRDLRDTGDEIRQQFTQLANERRALAQQQTQLSEQRKATFDMHRQEAEERLAELKAMLPDLEQRRKSIEALRAAVDAGYASNPAGSDALIQQRRALQDAVDSAVKQRHIYQDGMNALFQQNMAWSDENIAANRKQTLEIDQRLAGFNARESDLMQRQQANDQARESLQENSVTDPAVRAHMHQLIQDTHQALSVILQQRIAIREQFDSLHQNELHSAEARQDAGTDAIRVIREKHAEFAGKLADLEAESAAMQQEIRSLYDQEQARYIEELKAARAAQSVAMPTYEREQEQQ
jgi:chromosome segregation ATPase